MSNLGGSSGNGWSDLWQDGAGGNYFRYVDCGLGNPLISVSIPGNVPYTITGTPVPLSGASVGTVDVSVGGTIATTQSGVWTVGVTPPSSWPLSTGAATAANQSTEIGYLSAIASTASGPRAVTQSGTWSTGRTWDLTSGTDSVAAAQSGSWTVALGAGSAAIGTVAVTPPASWPLPTGSATAANQATEIGYLSTIASAASGPRAVTQSGTWSTGRTWTLASGTDTVSINPPGSWPLPAGAATQTTLAAILTQLGTPAQDGTAISAATLMSGGVGLNGWTSQGAYLLAAVNAKLPTLGPATIANSMPVVTPLPAAPVCGQKAIAVTNTAVVLGSGALTNGVIITAASSNAGTIYVGATGVNTTSSGTGTGYPLAPGTGISFAVANLSDLFINGTAADWVAYAGS